MEDAPIVFQSINFILTNFFCENMEILDFIFYLLFRLNKIFIWYLPNLFLINS